MQLIDDNTIHLTRGNIFEKPFSIEADNGEPYLFSANDVVRMRIMTVNKPDEIHLQKDFKVDTPGDTIWITLTGDETKIGELISKPTDYWYEMELNPDSRPETVVCFDQKGPKILKLYPEGGDKQ